MLKELTSLQHPLIKHLVKLRQNRDYRSEQQRVVVTGIKQVLEICSANPAATILTIDETLIPQGVKADRVILANEAVMKKASGLVSPEGLLAEVAMPPPSALNDAKYLLALEGINDPGNFGTLLRTALALGWEGVFILGNGCDPFNEKAIRASRGAIFRLPYRLGRWDDLGNLCRKNRLQPLAADLTGSKPEEIGPAEGYLLLLSNEARGLSREAGQYCRKISIPMPGEMESLNVAIAGGILMYLIRNK